MAQPTRSPGQPCQPSAGWPSLATHTHYEVPSGAVGERAHVFLPGVLALSACGLAAVLDDRLASLLT